VSLKAGEFVIIKFSQVEGLSERLSRDGHPGQKIIQEVANGFFFSQLNKYFLIISLPKMGISSPHADHADNVFYL
jgi:hypothetical protein